VTAVFYLSELFVMNINTTCPAGDRLLLESWISMYFVIKGGGFGYKNLIEVMSFKIQDLANIFRLKLRINTRTYKS
jgi:hypothetical protein